VLVNQKNVALHFDSLQVDRDPEALILIRRLAPPKNKANSDHRLSHPGTWDFLSVAVAAAGFDEAGPKTRALLQNQWHHSHAWRLLLHRHFRTVRDRIKRLVDLDLPPDTLFQELVVVMRHIFISPLKRKAAGRSL
jgi:hypothetical protein